MLIQSYAGVLKKVMATNAITNGFPARVATVTSPLTNAGIIQLNPDGLTTDNQILLFPFGQGANDDTMNIQLIGWKTFLASGVTLWMPFPICILGCTFGSCTGAATAGVDNTNFFADTITITLGNSNVDVELTSPANDTIGCALIDVKGCSMLELLIDINSSATNGNALYTPL